MGYMGFGMQSRIYKRRPRKPFSKRGNIPSYSPIPKYSRTLKIKAYIRESRYKYVFLGIAAFAGLLLLIKTYTYKFTLYSNNHSQLLKEIVERRNYKAFSFLVNSGKKRLLSNNVFGAYSEFNLAYNIHPDDDELNKLLIETLSILCSQDVEYCDELDEFLEIGIN